MQSPSAMPRASLSIAMPHATPTQSPTPMLTGQHRIFVFASFPLGRSRRRRPFVRRLMRAVDAELLWTGFGTTRLLPLRIVYSGHLQHPPCNRKRIERNRRVSAQRNRPPRKPGFGNLRSLRRHSSENCAGLMAPTRRTTGRRRWERASTRERRWAPSHRRRHAGRP